jgi:hypothetical protein
MSGAISHPSIGKNMKRAIIVGVAALTAFGLASLGCGNNAPSASGGNGGSKATGGASSGGASGGSGGKAGTGGDSSGGASGGSSTTSSTGGSTSSSCGTSDGTYEEDTTFGTAGATDPYKLNKWGTWGDGTGPALTQTTTGPSGLDCGSGCAMLTIDFSDGTKQYSAGSFVQFFGTSSDSTSNLLNETITAKIAVGVAKASGANSDVPISINLFGQDTYASTSGVDNLWSDDLGQPSSLDAASGWHTVTFKVQDAKVPSWGPTRTVCASGLHAFGITIQNNADINSTNGGVVTLYVQSVSVGSSGGSGGGGGGSAGNASGGGGGGGGGGSAGNASGGGGGGGGGSAGNASGGGGGGSAGNASGGGGGGGGSAGNASGGGGSAGSASGGASGGSSATSSSGGSTSSACGTANGTYKENTTFVTAGSTAPYNLNKWGTWGDGTAPTLTQTTTGPSGLDCSSGCAALAIDFSNGTAQYSAGSFIEYFGTASDSTANLLNETITAKVALGNAKANGATTAVPITINLFGQDTYASTSGVDNAWSDDLGSASSLDASSGWHTVTFKVVDAKVPSWSPTRTVCASALHAIGVTIENSAVVDGTNAGVVTLYVQSVTVAAP